jgi:hypothetical protein
LMMLFFEGGGRRPARVSECRRITRLCSPPATCRQGQRGGLGHGRSQESRQINGSVKA